jgi:hypothetical protein
MAKPVSVWNPKKGENPKKTPREKARAVRSGVSSMWRSLLSRSFKWFILNMILWSSPK